MTIKTVLHSTEQNALVKIWTKDIQVEAEEQLLNTASLPFIHKHVAAMPDVHLGLGATVGSVVPTIDAVIPAAVGVDIGCGMNAIRLSLKADQLPDNLRPIRNAIERVIPTGFKNHRNMRERLDLDLLVDLKKIEAKHPKMFNNAFDKANSQMGTLGGGNHFIELCIDEENYVWIMLHSGSRGIGNQIGRYFIEQAKEQMETWHINLPDKDLAYLPKGSPLFDDYVEAVEWAQAYAFNNRAFMMKQVLQVLQKSHLPEFEPIDEAINCHHNYIAQENHYGKNVYVTRKGAIRARVDELGIIPGSMGAQSFIVRGLGNAESFCSCSHGAGRRLSRTVARKTFTKEDLAEQTKGIECRKDEAVVDEIPAAYKPIEEVMENQTDLVEVVHTLKQVLNIKG